MATQIAPYVPAQSFDMIQEDPWSTAINAYRGVKAGQGQGLQNEIMKKKMPFVGPEADAAVQKAFLDIEKMEAEKPYWGTKAEADAKLAQSQAKWHGPQANAMIQRQFALSEIEQLQAENTKLDLDLKKARQPLEMQELNQKIRMNERMMKRLASDPRFGGTSNAESNTQQSGAEPSQTNNIAGMSNQNVGNPQAPNVPMNPELNSSISQQIQDQNRPNVDNRNPNNYINYNNVPQEIDFTDEAVSKFIEPYISQPTMAGMKAKQEAIEKGRVNLWNKRYEKLVEEAGPARDLGFNLTGMMDAYDRIGPLEKGTFLGKLEDMSQGAITLKKYRNGAVLDEMKQMVGPQSREDLAFITARFPAKELEDKDFKEVMTLMQVVADRKVEMMEFFGNHPELPAPVLENAWSGMVRNNPINKDPRYLQVVAEEKVKNMPDEEVQQKLDMLYKKERGEM